MNELGEIELIIDERRILWFIQLIVATVRKIQRQQI